MSERGDAWRRDPARVDSCAAACRRRLDGRIGIGPAQPAPRRRPRGSRSSSSRPRSCCSRRCCRCPPPPPTGERTAARRCAVHRRLDDLRHRPLDRRHRDALFAVRQGDHLRRRQHRRHRRADPRLDPRPGHLEAPRAAGQAHRRERLQPAAHARRPGQRGPDRAPRRGRPAAAHRRAVDARDRGGSSRPRSTPRSCFAGIDPLDALWEAPFYAAMAFTNTGFTPNAGGLAPFADDYFLLTVLMAGVFLGCIGFPVIYTLWRHVLARAQVVAAHQAHAHHHRAALLRRRRGVPRPRVRQPEDLRRRWMRGTPRSRRSSSRR